MNMAHENVSPWLRQVRRNRPVIALPEDIDSDIAVVGGGISGIATSYFLLSDTSQSVILLEKDRVAHGATGYNGGQAVAAFERSIIELCKRFGEDLVSEGLKAVNGAWDLMYSMISDTGIDVDLQEVFANLAFSSIDDVLLLLRERQLSERLGLPWQDVFLAEDVAGAIPEEYRFLFRKRQRKELEEMLLTRNSGYICVQMVRTGLMNSALFCEELVSWMLDKYSGRFRVYEDTPVQRIRMGSGSFNGKGGSAVLKTAKNVVNARHAVLCTNGYNDLIIEGTDGSIIMATHGVLGFMIGYADENEKDPAASVYFDSKGQDLDDGYYYLSRRGYIEGPKKVLVSVGGQDRNLGEKERHSLEQIPHLEEYYSRIENFCKKTVIDIPGGRQRDFSWNGLMGYTSSGVRVIGPDPIYQTIIYNLGCNGIGILPSIYGGKRVAQIINGEKLAPSIFDPGLLRL